MTDEKAPKRTEKLQLMLDDIEIEAIDDWRFKNRLPSRAAAIRELIRMGLSCDMSGETIDREKSSTDFRVAEQDGDE
ncbi:hypothetical protein [Minwuia sp.]|uniref:hypothetical protein n=1 Tax=Minwuia sp. TaxID=2493630 RepID=UPI003A8D8931